MVATLKNTPVKGKRVYASAFAWVYVYEFYREARLAWSSLCERQLGSFKGTLLCPLHIALHSCHHVSPASLCRSPLCFCGAAGKQHFSISSYSIWNWKSESATKDHTKDVASPNTPNDLYYFADKNANHVAVFNIFNIFFPTSRWPSVFICFVTVSIP